MLIIVYIKFNLGQFHAAQLIINKGFDDTEKNRSFLIALLDILENAKAVLSSEAAMQSDTAASSYIIQFAMKLFIIADNEEKAGQSSKKTARLFILASQFLQLLEDVGGISSEIENKIKYAKYKAAEITRRENENNINVDHGKTEGTSSTPPLDATKGSSSPNHSPSISSTHLPFAPPSIPHVSESFTFTAPIIATSLPSYSGSFAPMLPSSTTSPSNISSMDWNEAEKHARFAISAIQFEDRDTAIRELEKSLAILSNVNIK